MRSWCLAAASVLLLGALPPAAFAQAGKPGAADAPTSRDELFGLKPPSGAPAAEEKKAVSVSGFYDFLGAYTYSEPSHWSNAVNRLQLSAQGAFSPNVKWKIGGRFDIDPVYYWSDFYLQPVKENQRTSAFWRETYLDFSAGGLDFRVGAQNIVWGEVVGLFFADVVSRPRSARVPAAVASTSSASRSWPRAPSTSRATRHLELIWIPVQTFDDIGKPGADFYPVPPAVADLGDRSLGVPEPGDAGEDAVQLGLRHSCEHAVERLGPRGVLLPELRQFSPTFYRIPGPSARQPFVFRRNTTASGRLAARSSKDFGQFVLRAEACLRRRPELRVHRPRPSRRGLAATR